MSAASSILFTLSYGKAQELHEITFNQISIFATVSNHFPLFGSCHHGNHKCITLKEARLNEHTIYKQLNIQNNNGTHLFYVYISD